MAGILRRIIGVGLALSGAFMILQDNFAVQMIGFVVISLGILMSLGK